MLKRERKDLESNLYWIIEYADLLQSYIDRLGDDRDLFLEDRLFQDCCRAKINDIAQCLVRIRDHHPSVFKKHFAPIIGGTIGMRNITVHQYEDTDYGILWDFIKDELPSIVDACESALSAPAVSDNPKPRRLRFRSSGISSVGTVLHPLPLRIHGIRC